MNQQDKIITCAYGLICLSGFIFGVCAYVGYRVAPYLFR